jgi:hypothetical protein
MHFLVIAIAVLLVGCGSRSNDDVPPELLQAIADSRGGGDDYPEGPYGSAVGDVARDLCVTGWRDPRGSDYDPDASERICFSDFFDSEAEDHRLLVVNTSAVWCSACATEYGGASGPSFSEEVAERHDDGLRALGTIFQDIEAEPAGIDEAVLWSKRFEVDFPFGYDESFAMGEYAHPELQPFNMVMDTRTMEIVLQVEGFEPETLWSAVDDLLDR